MKFDERFVEDRLRIAEQQEIVSSNSQLFGDLHEVLNEENLQEGVAINFGDQREKLGLVLDMLRIPEFLSIDPSPIHVRTISSVCGSSTGYHGVNRKDAMEVPLLDFVDAVQADHWSTFLTGDIYPTMKAADEVITSRVAITASHRDEAGNATADTEGLAVVIGVKARYLPDLMERASLAYAFRDIENEQSFPRDVIGPLVGELAARQVGLALPGMNYFLKFGPLSDSFANPMNTPDDIYSFRPYVVENGRVVALD